MRLVMIGPPGAGKGTQSERLARHFAIPHLSTGDMLREASLTQSELGKLTSQYMISGQLVPDPIILDLIGQRLEQPDCAAGCVLDGFPRTVSQAKALDLFFQQHGEDLDAAVEIQVSEDELVRRLTSRKRQDDLPDVIRQRLRGYRAQTLPVTQYYQSEGSLRVIEGEGTPDEIFTRILDQLNGAKQVGRRTG